MRLIALQTLTLEEFVDNVPKYAILSHRWEEEEVTYQDFLQPDVRKNMVGFKKIMSACKKAVEDGLEYLWVDTCCIDKSSSAELSGAVCHILCCKPS